VLLLLLLALQINLLVFSPSRITGSGGVFYPWFFVVGQTFYKRLGLPNE
jgi:hypothetical protein